MVVNGVVVGPFEEEEEATGVASDVVKVKGEDRNDPGTVTIPQYRFNKTKPHTAFAPVIVGMSGQIHSDFLRLLWVLADKQMRSYYESMGKEDKIGTEAFRWARAKVFNCKQDFSW